jgi:hypothetical protein
MKHILESAEMRQEASIMDWGGWGGWGGAGWGRVR